METVATRISLVLLLFTAAGLAQTPARKAAPKSAPKTVPTPNAPLQSSDPKPASPVPVSTPIQAATFSIDSIAVEGARIHQPEAILAVAGLKKGDHGEPAIFDAARDRLIASGYFETVAYRYKPSAAGGYEVTFEVQEFAQLMPIRVEALPLTTDEAVALLRAKDPLFASTTPGAMPGTEPGLRRAAALIQEYIREKKQLANVAGRVVAVAPNKFEIQFTPARGLPAVAEVEFEGSKLIAGIDLRNSMAEVAFGQPFAEASFRSLLDSQLGPLYEAKGHLHVTWPQLVTTPSTRVNGLDLKVTVDEGDEYKLTRVAIAGSGSADSARILRAAKLPQMTIANFAEVRQAAARVSDYMRSQGYLDARVSTEKKLDEKNKTAEFFIVVEPGPAYTFGQLTVNGLGLDGEAAIKKMWSLKPGDAFPATYPAYFAAKVKEEGLFDNLGDVSATQQIRPGTQTVDVIVDFKGTPPKERAPRRPPGAIPGPH